MVPPVLRSGRDVRGKLNRFVLKWFNGWAAKSDRSVASPIGRLFSIADATGRVPPDG